MSRPSQFPIIPDRRRDSTIAPHPMKIPWSIADLAYSVYVRHGGGDQSLERLAERGGFGASEMDMFLPDWRERVAALLAGQEHIATLVEALERYESLEGVLSTEDIIFLTIQAERRRQRMKWGSEYDAQHTPEEWQALIVERMGRPLPALEDHAYSVRFVEIAAMAVAVLEAHAAQEVPDGK